MRRPKRTIFLAVIVVVASILFVLAFTDQISTNRAEVSLNSKLAAQLKSGIASGDAGAILSSVGVQAVRNREWEITGIYPVAQRFPGLQMSLTITVKLDSSNRVESFRIGRSMSGLFIF